MKKLFIASCMAIFLLSGCGTFKRKEVVIETQYIVRKASEAQKVLPPYPSPIDVKTADQLGLAQWIASNEERQLRLEALIRELIAFYEKEPLKEEVPIKSVGN